MDPDQKVAGAAYQAGCLARMDDAPRDPEKGEWWLRGWDNVNKAIAGGHIQLPETRAKATSACHRR